MTNISKKAVLIILDGYGIAPPSEGNAVYKANTPNLDRLFSENAYTTLQASGLDVGLPAGQMGNSEVGHTNIGAGRVVFQILPKMSQEIKNGKFFKNKAYIKAMDDAKANGKALHIMGLLSSGGVHSHIEHIFAILDMAKQRGLERVYVHCFLDGRDVAPVEEAVDIHTLKTALLCHVEDGKDMLDMAVDAAGGQKPHDVQRLAVCLGIVHCLDIRLVLEELAVFDLLAHLGQDLEHDAPRADVRVSDLGVAHLPGGQTHVQPGGLKRGVGIFGEETVKVRGVRLVDGVALGWRSDAVAVKDDENSFF